MEFLQASSLTTGLDNVTGGAGDDSFVANTSAGVQTLTALDKIDGGAGTDSLTLTVTGNVTSLTPAGSTVTGIENVAITSNGTVAANTTTWTGTENLTVIATGDSSVTAAVTTDAVVSVTAGDLAVTGGKNVTATLAESAAADTATGNASTVTSSAGVITFTQTETFTTSADGGATALATGTITTTGGSSVSITSNAIAGASDNAGDTNTIGAIAVNGAGTVTSATVVQSAASAATGKQIIANGAVTITDLNTATKADTITTVALHNYGNSTITGNALTNLDLKGGAVTASGTLGISQSNGITTAGSIPTALTIDISGKVGAITDTNNQYKTLSIVASAAATIADLDFTSATSIAASGAGVTTISAGTDIAAATTITSTGGGLTVTPALGNGVTFTGGDGVEKITLGANTKTTTTGAGNDVVTLSGAALGYQGSVDAGEGIDTLSMTAANAIAASATTTFAGTIAGFERLVVGAAADTGTIALAKLDNINYVTTADVANTKTLTLTGATSGFTLVNNAGTTGDGAIVVTLADATGTSDELNVSVSAAAAKDIQALTATGFEVINFATDDSATTPTGIAHVVSALTDADATTISVAGDAGLDLTFTGTKVTSFDASGVTKGAVDWTSGALAAAATVKGGAGANTIDLSASSKAMNYTGGAAVDTITTGAGADTIVAGAGNDVIVAGNGANTVHGDAGNDSITTGTGADTIEGGAGNDTIVAGNGANIINGGDGNDAITGGSGVDTVDGGAGTDTFTLDNTEQAGSGTVDGAVINLSDTALTQAGVFALTGKYLSTVNPSVAAGTATYLYSNESSTNADVVDTIAGIENVVGTGEVDYIVGSADANKITGGAGIDYVTGGAGQDTFVFNTVVLAANATNITDMVGGNGGDFLQFDAATFDAYTAGTAVAIGDAGDITNANTVYIDTVANVITAGVNTTNGDAVLFIASDTGNIYYDADGDFSAGAVIIGSITASEVADLLAVNFTIV